MEKFFQEDRWNVDVAAAFCSALMMTYVLRALNEGLYGGIVLPLAAFIVTIHLGSRLRRRTRSFQSWVWVSVGGAFIFTVLFTVTAVPACMAYYHNVDPRASITERLGKIGTRELPYLVVPLAMWLIPALFSLVTARLFTDLAVWLFGSRRMRIDPAKALLGVILFAATFFGTIALTELFR